MKKIVTIALGLFIVLYLVANTYYKDGKKEEYTEKIQRADNYSAVEKKWIKQNQGQDGEIYMNYTGDTKDAGDVNPYFACLAAQGLLADEPDQEDMECVRKYLVWHREHFIKAKGEIENYRLVDGRLEPTGERDSVDSYVAVFLSLLCRYGSLGGDLNGVDLGFEALRLGLSKLESLTQDGLTQVDSDSAVFYLMDNVEVLAAYTDVAELAASAQGKDWLGKEQPSLVKHTEQVKKQSENAIKQLLWNEGAGRFEIGLGNTGKVLSFSGWDKLYPNAVAQIYPTAFGLNFPKIDQKSLYRQFRKEFSWERVAIEKKDGFNWCVLEYIAVEMGDITAAQDYLKEYYEKVQESRKYPLYTTDAGWIVKSCGSLKKHYRQKMESGILSDLLAGLKEN